MNLLSQYIAASTHLYGVVPKQVVADTYNEQNDEQITLEEIEQCFRDNQKTIEEAFVYSEGDYFAHETVLTFDGIEAMLQHQAGKARYIPEKEELLKYLDDFYFEENTVYTTLYDYVLENLVDGDEERAKDVCEDIQGMIGVQASFRILMNQFDRMRVSFKTRKQRETVRKMVKDLQKNVRLWHNNGHTDRELKTLGYSGPTVASIDTGSVQKKKLGRNDPCHCGSGKKYKKCCMHKDEKLKKTM